MKQYIASILVLMFLTGAGSSLYSQENKEISKEDNDNSITPFSNIWGNTMDSFTGYNFLFHAGGAASTVLIIKSDTDYNVHNYFAEREDKINPYTVPAVYIGYVGPLAMGLGLYAAGYTGDDRETLAAGCAVLQASFLAWSYSTVLKTFTGRPGPDQGVYTKESDRSGEFEWGFMRNGIHYGWPSGHMSVSTAVISSMVYFYDDSVMVKVMGGIVWSYMAFGVTAHEGNTMHWLSDAAAGSLMGFAIGSTVGRNFRNRLVDGAENQKNGEVSFSPLISRDVTGLMVSMTF